MWLATVKHLGVGCTPPSLRHLLRWMAWLWPPPPPPFPSAAGVAWRITAAAAAAAAAAAPTPAHLHALHFSHAAFTPLPAAAWLGRRRCCCCCCCCCCCRCTLYSTSTCTCFSCGRNTQSTGAPYSLVNNRCGGWLWAAWVSGVWRLGGMQQEWYAAGVVRLGAVWGTDRGGTCSGQGLGRGCWKAPNQGHGCVGR
jgi:hypothetical protein